MNKQSMLWSFIFLVLLLLSFTPFVLITISLMMIPIVILFVKLDLKRFLVHLVVILLAVYLVSFMFGVSLLGTVAVILTLFFMTPSVVMGRMYRKKGSARSVITAGVVAMLAQLLLLLLILTLSGVQVIGEMRDYMKSSMENLPAELQGMVPGDLMDQVLQVMTQLLPLYLIGFSMYYAVITHWLARKFLVRSGETLPGFKPAKEWMLPRSLIWYYLIALILSYIYDDPDESMIFMVLLNIMPLMMFAFTVQAFGFLFFIADHRRWSTKVPKILTVFGVMVLILIPFLMQLVSLIGLFDVAFPIRDRIKNKASKD